MVFDGPQISERKANQAFLAWVEHEHGPEKADEVAGAKQGSYPPAIKLLALSWDSARSAGAEARGGDARERADGVVMELEDALSWWWEERL
jgi:hypothetical protein